MKTPMRQLSTAHARIPDVIALLHHGHCPAANMNSDSGPPVHSEAEAEAWPFPTHLGVPTPEPQLGQEPRRLLISDAEASARRHCVPARLERRSHSVLQDRSRSAERKLQLPNRALGVPAYPQFQGFRPG